MENNYPYPENSVINLKQLPPIDPSRIGNSSFNLKSSKSNTSAAPKMGKPKFNRGLKSFKFAEALRESNSGSTSSGKTSETHGNTTTDSDSAENGMKQGSARSTLYEICAANHWKPPVFDCCKEEGPSHQKKFTFKVIIEIEAGLKTIVECFGSPHPKKKTAADHAAEGALWFLKHQVMLSSLGCQSTEDDNRLGEPPMLFPVESCVLFLLLGNFIPEDTRSRDHTIIFLGAELDVPHFMKWRRITLWRKSLKLSYGA